jgi:hypothetical protein
MEFREYVGIHANDFLGSSAALEAYAEDPFLHRTHEVPYREDLQLEPSLRDYLRYINVVVIGTGGQLEWPISFDSMLESSVPTGALAVLQRTNTSDREHGVRTVSDDVATIKAAFGLSVSQLAEVLKVKRPTIYSWIDSDQAPDSLRKANRDRLSELCGFAKAWNEVIHVPPGKYLTANLGDNSNLFQLLRAMPLDHQAIRQAISAIREVMSKGDRAQAFSQRLRGLGFVDRPPLVR